MGDDTGWPPIITCKKCGFTITESAKICPSCGAKVNRSRRILLWSLLALIIFIIVIWVWFESFIRKGIREWGGI